MPTTKRCKDCVHFESFDGAVIDFGECRHDPPRISEVMLLLRSAVLTNLSPAIQWQSSIWPVVKGSTDFCDKWKD